MLAISPIRFAPRRHVRPGDAGVINRLLLLRKIGPAGFIRPGSNPAAGFSARPPALALAEGATLPVAGFAGAAAAGFTPLFPARDRHLGALEALQSFLKALRIRHLLLQFFQFPRRGGKVLGRP